jgi:uncharacterized protein YcfJ
MGRITRRTVLQNIGVGTLGSVSIVGGAVADGPTREIVTVRSGDESLVTKEVPQSWYQHLNQVRAVNARLQDRLLDRSGVLAVGIGAGSTAFGGKRGFKIDVQVLAGTTPAVPDQADGVSVNTVERSQRAEPLASCNETNTGDFSSVPAGAHIGTSIYTNDSYGGTVSAHVYDGSGNVRTMTANHVAGGFCSDSTGKTMYQGSETYGTVDQANKSSDTALIEKTDDDDSFDYTVREDDSTRYDFYGHKTNDGIADLKSSGATVYKTGITSGTTSGSVQNFELGADDECAGYYGHAVTSTVETGKGDSGAPVYTVEYVSPEPRAIFVHTVNEGEGSSDGSYDCTREIRARWEETRGMGFYHLSNDFGLSIV